MHRISQAIAAASLVALAGLAAPQVAAAQDVGTQAKVTSPFAAGANIGNSAQAFGPGTGTLSIGSITLSNFATTTQQVFIFSPITSDGTCTGSVTGGAGPQDTILVPAGQTVHLTFPTLLVMPKIGRAASCFAAEVTTNLNGGSVRMLVVGQSR